MKTIENDEAYFASADGKEREERIGSFYSIRIYSQRYYILKEPHFIPARLWFWLAGLFIVAEGYDPTKESK